MKRFKALAAAALLSAFALSGVQAKTLKMAYDADPVSLDPHEQLSGGTLQLSHMIFDPLIRWNQELGFDPRLAEKWERIDEKTVRFSLRKGVKFHSGNEMTALDVRWTFDRLKRSPDFKGIFAPFEALNIVDKYTIDVVTKEPYPLVLHTALRFHQRFGHRTFCHHQPRAGRQSGIRALWRLLGQRFARQREQDRVHADQGGPDPRGGAAFW
jgi:peptide/nickel transport system substrate-binding protein